MESGTPPSFNAVPNYRATTKWADQLLTADSLPQRMRRAFTALRTGRPGPVMLEIPTDVAVEELSEELDYTAVTAARAGVDPDAVRDAARLLLAAEHPMIWAGQGVLYAEASEAMTAVAEFLGAPVMTTLLGKSGFNETAPAGPGHRVAQLYRHVTGLPGPLRRDPRTGIQPDPQRVCSQYPRRQTDHSQHDRPPRSEQALRRRCAAAG